MRFPISVRATSHLGRPISCGKFVFPSHYLPLPILDVPSPVVNLSSRFITCHFPSWTSHLLWYIRLPISWPATSHFGRPISCGKFLRLITCHFPSWTSHLLWKIRLPISLPAASHLGRPISCGKFVFPSNYLPPPILDVPSPVVTSSSHLITCYFPSWTSVFSWKSYVMCKFDHLFPYHLSKNEKIPAR